MRFFCLPNLSSQDLVDLDPKLLPVKRPSFEDKKEFRAWCNDVKTAHCFYNCVEPLTPSLRVTKTNSAFYLHGFVADYDSETGQDKALELIRANAPAGLLPRYISSTFSGGIRLVWEFSDPVLVDQPEIASRFLHHLVKELGVNNLCAGYDHNSENLSQYFEAGTNWNEIPNSKPISSKILGTLFYRTANEVRIKADGPTIPIEKVAEEVISRWPGRVADFSVGQRVPLFWVEPFEDRVGAQIGDLGMLCYSTRAGKSFVSWSEILGPEFMQNYMAQRVGAAVENIFYDGLHYWIKGEGRYMRRTTEDTIRYLKTQGISSKPDPKSTASESDRVLVAVQERHEVKAAAYIVHDKRQLVNINGDLYLNVSKKKIIEPAEKGEPKDFPWLWEFWTNIWDTPKQEQHDFFFAWLQYAYLTCLDGRPAQGHAVFTAGPVSSGKTFINHHFLGAIFGGYSDASEYLLGRTNFNKQDAEVYLWAIDDSRGAARWDNKAQFSANLKKHVANPQVRCEGKGKDAFTIPWKGRISVTCNIDKTSLDIIPHMDINIKDKLSLFKWNSWKATFLGKGKTEAVVAKELPFFLAYLRDWKTPEYVIGDEPRFGVKHYHHPFLMQEAMEMSGETRLAELLALWREDFATTDKNKGMKVWATATGIRKYLSQEASCRDALKEFGRERMAAALQQMNIESRRHGGNIEYLIYTPKNETNP